VKTGLACPAASVSDIGTVARAFAINAVVTMCPILRQHSLDYQTKKKKLYEY
jgi:hypothetical protein